MSQDSTGGSRDGGAQVPALRILILALNGLEMDRRVENEARLLAARGHRVTRIGMVEYADQAEREVTEYDTILRMRPSWHRPKPSRAPGVASDAVPLARQWRLKVALMSMVRRAFSRTMWSIDRIRAWSRWNRAYVETCRTLECDAIIACDLDALGAGVALKRLLGCTLVYDAHELWTEQHHHRQLTAFFKWLMNRREARLVRAADLVTTVSRRFSDRMASRYGIAPPLVVYSGSADCIGEPVSSQSPLRAYFQGSLSADRGLEDVVSAMTLLNGKVILTLQGQGPLEQALRSMVDDLGLEQVVRFVAPCAPTDVAQAAAAHDVGIVAGHPTSLNARLTTPNRPFAYFGGGLAVITSAQLEEVGDIVARFECGTIIEGDGPEAIAAALTTLAADPDLVTKMKHNSLKACEEFAWDKQFGPVVDFLEDGLEAGR